MEDIQEVFKKIGSVAGNSITWEEFLKAMYKWLIEIRAISEKVENIDAIAHPYVFFIDYIVYRKKRFCIGI